MDFVAEYYYHILMKAFSPWYHDSSRLLGLCWKSTHQNITKLETTFKLVFTSCLLTTIHYQYFATTYMSTLEKAVEKHFFSNTLWFCSPFKKKPMDWWLSMHWKNPNSSSQRRSEQQAFWKFNFRTRVILLFFRSSVARTHTKFPFDPYPKLKLTYNAHSFINAEKLNFDL